MTKVIFLILLCATAVAPAADITVTDNTALKKAVKSLQPGDTVILSDGAWRDTEIKLIVDGSEDKPITLRAQTPGKVILSGKSRLSIGGKWLVVQGLVFKDG